MASYIGGRLIQALATLFFLSLLFFLLAHFRPGAYCYAYDVACQRSIGQDQATSVQYFTWLGRLVHGDFGTSLTGLPVRDVIAQRVAPTVLLVGVAFILQQVIALPLGIMAALRPYSLLDSTLTAISYVALSLPAFVLGFFLIFVFAVQGHMLPVGHYESPTIPLLFTGDWFSALKQDPALVLGDLTQHLVLPATVLALTGIAVDSRFMRASMFQVLQEEYIRTARAKGLRRSRIIFKHAFRNALLPIVTNIGLYLPALLSGAVVVETVFNWGGLGAAFGTAVTQQGGDVPTQQALLMISALAMILSSLLADLVVAWLDPRIHFRSGDI